MNRIVKYLLAASVLIAALVAVAPQAEAHWGHYHAAYYAPAPYVAAYAPAPYYVGYGPAYVAPVPYATYYNYRTFYGYAPPARAWVQPVAAPVYVPVAPACGCR